MAYPESPGSITTDVVAARRQREVIERACPFVAADALKASPMPSISPAAMTTTQKSGRYLVMNVKFTDLYAGGRLDCGIADLICVRTVSLREAGSDRPWVSTA